jgi:hypothetical protein
VIGHLGPRVSALLDGQLDAAEEERAWEHVHACHLCRDLVEREGWVKTRLAELGQHVVADPAPAPSDLKGALLLAPLLPPGEGYLVAPHRHRSRSASVAVGSGAVGMAMLGVLLVGAAPASAPATDRRAPVTSLVGPRSAVSFGGQEVVDTGAQQRARRQPAVASPRQ